MPTVVLGLDVKTFCLVHLTQTCVVCQNSDVPPRRGSPVGVVVPLLRAFVAATVSVGILTGVDGRTDAKLI